jgi:ABC-type bacteriocin/lantibiotic exporter with double-glycine peptidase domain
MAELDALINQLPEKENSQVTENGKNFSGGQRQRIILARALYKDADLYIFDEAFSELDAAAETAIMQELQQLTKKGKMILLITHRTSLHAYCNKIISLHE